MDVKPVEGVLFVFDPLEGHEPFNDGVTVEGPDTVAEKTVGVGVDHIVLDGWQVDHSSIFVAGDRQVGDQRYLMSVEWSTVDLVSP